MQVRRGISGFASLAISSTLLAAGMILPHQKPVSAKLDYSRDVLPILSDKCFKCHGPDAPARMANLRLDQSESAFAGRHGQWAIVPGKPASSLVVNRVTSKDSPMPPLDSGKSLTKSEIEILRRWIAEGAHYGKLWSFEPLPASVPVPKIDNPWVRGDLDRFILARLRKEKLSPSAPASRDRWLRRVTFDLTGLPPTEKDIADFAADKRPDAFDHVVDRLLASPHFGERVAVEWLDAARYSDSYGYQSDLLSPTWPYRDWVVKSFNANLPYDRFLTAQLAGDLMPAASPEQHRELQLATAFNRLHRQSNEGGSIPLEYRTEYAADRVETFGTAVLGLTLNCARCHDHKFDPITQKEYYQLFAYFNSIDEFGLLLSSEIVPTPSMLLPTPAQSAQLKALQMANESARVRVEQAKKDAEPEFQKWLASPDKAPSVTDVSAKIDFSTESGGKFANSVAGAKPIAEKLGKVDVVPGHNGKAVVFDGDNGLAVRSLPAHERSDPFSWSFWISDPLTAKGPVVLLQRTGGTDVGFCGFDLMLENGFLTARVMRAWPGNAVAVQTLKPLPKGTWTHIGWTWDGSGRADGLKLYLDGKPAPTTVLQDKLWKKINAYGDLGASGGDWAFGLRFRDAGFKGGKLSDVSYAARALSPIEVAQLHDGHSLAEALKSPGGHEAELREYYASALEPKTRTAQAAVQKAQLDLANGEEGVYEIPVMEESRKPIPAYLLARGLYDAPRNDKTRLQRGVPHALTPMPVVQTNDRLALAKWVTSPNHPLTARVAVNRFWQMIFGVGLVESSENFGVQGTRPTHRELLDYLSRRFVDSGWNVKALLKGFVLSATYRQDSTRTKTLNERDPENRLYARGPSHRLGAEMIRDMALAAAGLLNPKMGGPPVNPYQPAGLWTENNTMTQGFVQSKGADLYRRSLYSTWKRTTPVPSMLIFDATSREACTMRRPATDTPMQALVLLNDIQFVEAARKLAETVMQLPGNDQQRIREGFVRLAGHEPSPRELTILEATLHDQRKEYEAKPEDAKKLVTMGDSKPTAQLPTKELAAMTVTMQTVLNSDAVIWKR